MTQYKLGRLAPTRPFGVAELGTYAMGKLPGPPAQVKPPVAQWGMDGNDQFGDCTIAGVDHLLAAWNAEFGEKDARPTQSTIVETYFSLTGGADAGLNEHAVLETWRTKGLFGNKIAAYAPINTRNIVEIHQAIALYGAAYLGIMLPQSAQEDFAAGKPWTYDPSSPIEGGHCIDAVGYDATGIQCVSWGAVVTVTYPFLAHFLEEAWCVIGHELVEAKKDALGIDLATLTRDLNQLSH